MIKLTHVVFLALVFCVHTFPSNDCSLLFSSLRSRHFDLTVKELEALPKRQRKEVQRHVKRDRSPSTFQILSLSLGQGIKKIDAISYQIFKNAAKEAKQVPKTIEEATLNPDQYITIWERDHLYEQKLLGMYRHFVHWHKGPQKYVGQLFRSYSSAVATLYNRKIRFGLNRKLGFIGSLLPTKIFDLFTVLRAERLCGKLIRNPNYKYTESENTFLVNKGVYEDFERFRIELGQHSSFYKLSSNVRKLGYGALASLVALGVSLNLNANEVITTKESLKSISDYRNHDKSNWKGMDERDRGVELIYFDNLPHVVVRIGNNVFNVGVEHVTHMDLETLKSSDYGKFLEHNHTKVVLDLNFSSKEALLEAFVKRIGTSANFALMYNTPIGETMSILERSLGINVPPVFEQSQVGSLAYFQSLHILDTLNPNYGPNETRRPLVKQVYYATKDGERHPLLQIPLDTAGSYFFLRNAGTIFIWSTGFDLVTDKLRGNPQ